MPSKISGTQHSTGRIENGWANRSIESAVSASRYVAVAFGFLAKMNRQFSKSATRPRSSSDWPIPQLECGENSFGGLEKNRKSKKEIDVHYNNFIIISIISNVIRSIIRNYWWDSSAVRRLAQKSREWIDIRDKKSIVSRDFFSEDILNDIGHIRYRIITFNAISEWNYIFHSLYLDGIWDGKVQLSTFGNEILLRRAGRSMTSIYNSSHNFGRLNRIKSTDKRIRGL